MDFTIKSVHSLDSKGNLNATLSFNPDNFGPHTGTITQETVACLMVPAYNELTRQALTLPNDGSDLQNRKDIFLDFLPAGTRINLLQEYDDVSPVFTVQVMDQPMYYVVPADVIQFDEELSDENE